MTELNPLAYLERDAFTSEKFKIEVSGLPKYLGLGHFKKFLAKEEINPHKIKPIGGSSKFAFMCFRDDSEKESAIEKINKLTYRGSKLSAKPAKACEDPLIKKRKLAEANVEIAEESKVPIADKIEEVTLPYSKLSMGEQHHLKKVYAESTLVQYKEELKKANHVLYKSMQNQDGVCPVDDTVASPESERYRNKGDFTVGINPETSEITVGFRVASYKKGVSAVGPVHHLRHLPEAMLKAVVGLEEYIRSTPHLPFNPEDHSGVWRNVIVRVTEKGDVMGILVVHPQGFTDEEKTELNEGLKKFVLQSGVFTSFFVQFQGTKRGGEIPDVIKLAGEDHITESVLGLSFRISPLAFFQVNTKGAEVLYKLVGDIADISPKSVVLDVCCGTGTIGLSLAKRSKKVYGIELVASAVDDAKFNANANGITNCEFLAGRAEDKIFQVLDLNRSEEDIVAIVDPPRAGLHQKCIQAIRRAEQIKRLVYVSCDAKCAMKSFVDLSRSTSNTYAGKPFVPKRVIPVDLFPYTPHCEIVILFER